MAIASGVEGVVRTHTVADVVRIEREIGRLCVGCLEVRHEPIVDTGNRAEERAGDLVAAPVWMDTGVSVDSHEGVRVVALRNGHRQHVDLDPNRLELSPDALRQIKRHLPLFASTAAAAE